MATLNNRVFDNGLSVLTSEADRLDICSQEPTTYTEATSTYTLGNNTSFTVASPSDRTGGGRKVTVSAISGATVTGTGTATHYALVDVSESRLLVTGAMNASQGVNSGNTFSTDSFDIGIPDPA